MRWRAGRRMALRLGFGVEEACGWLRASGFGLRASRARRGVSGGRESAHQTGLSAQHGHPGPVCQAGAPAREGSAPQRLNPATGQRSEGSPWSCGGRTPRRDSWALTQPHGESMTEARTAPPVGSPVSGGRSPGLGHLRIERPSVLLDLCSRSTLLKPKPEARSPKPEARSPKPEA